MREQRACGLLPLLLRLTVERYWCTLTFEEREHIEQWLEHVAPGRYPRRIEVLGEGRVRIHTMPRDRIVDRVIEAGHEIDFITTAVYTREQPPECALRAMERA